MAEIKDLIPVFAEVLENEEIVLLPETTAADVDGWDSLAHIYLVVGIEKKFKVKFTTKEIQSWSNVGDILKDINDKASVI